MKEWKEWRDKKILDEERQLRREEEKARDDREERHRQEMREESRRRDERESRRHEQLMEIILLSFGKSSNKSD